MKVALLGAGVVGSQVARILGQEAESLRQRIGRPLELVGIGVRRLDVERPGIDPGLFTTDVHGLVTRGDLDLVVEVIGGIEPARSLLTEAMNAGASVITANKALLVEIEQEHALWRERWHHARRHGGTSRAARRRRPRGE